MSSLPFTQSPADPSLKDVLDALKKDVFLSLNCHHVGTVQSFDTSNQTASVTINYKKTFYQLNSGTGLYDPILLDYPILVDCPVICLGGGQGALTFPIQQGDECLVLFNDRDMDNWFKGGSGTSVATPRLHSFADAVIIVGLRSLGNSLGSYDTARAVLRYGSTMVGVGASQVKIANDSTTLNTLLQDLMTDLENLTAALITLTTAMSAATPATVVATIAVPSAAAVTAITTVQSSLISLATQIGDLLE